MKSKPAIRKENGDNYLGYVKAVEQRSELQGMGSLLYFMAFFAFSPLSGKKMWGVKELVRNLKESGKEFGQNIDHLFEEQTRHSQNYINAQTPEELLPLVNGKMASYSGTVMPEPSTIPDEQDSTKNNFTVV